MKTGFLLFLSARVNPEDIKKGIDAGADDYLTKPIDHQVLEAKMKAMQRIATMRHKLVDATADLKAANAELKQLVNVDGLTGLSNRRYMDEFLAKEVARATRQQQPLTVILCDADHFKAYNDNYGHLQGDDCLKSVARALKNVCKRPGDLAARYGGEEFAIILPDTTHEGALLVAEALRSSVEGAAIPHEFSSTAQVVTMSMGVCTLVPDPNISPDVFLKKADEALYQAKQAGRNQVKANF